MLLARIIYYTTTNYKNITGSLGTHKHVYNSCKDSYLKHLIQRFRLYNIFPYC